MVVALSPKITILSNTNKWWKYPDGEMQRRTRQGSIALEDGSPQEFKLRRRRLYDFNLEYKKICLKCIQTVKITFVLTERFRFGLKYHAVKT